MEVRGARILVTAGSRRLGAALAEDLAAAGAHVAITYRSAPGDAAAVVERIRRSGVNGHAIEADLADAAAAREAPAAAAAALGGLDGLVHCASAGFRPAALAEIDEGLFDEAIGATLKGALFTAQGAAEAIGGDGPGDGAIVLIGDLAGIVGWPKFLPHSAAKGGLRALSSGLARGLAPRIRVNMIHPGTVLPEDGTTDEALDELRSTLPLRRLGEPADIARAVRYLLEATYVTGTELIVDGGRSLRLGA